MFKNIEKTCCGTTHVGERGQIVIPAEARKLLNIKPGDQFVTFTKHGKLLILIKADEFNKFIEKITGKVEDLKKKAKNG